MLGNNLRFAFRNILRNKIFSAINILGLAISLAVFVLMALYIRDEVGFDQFHTNAERIYRVADDKQTTDVLLRSAQSAAPVAPALLADFPEVQAAARIISTESLVAYKRKLFEERRIYFADPSLLRIFSFTLVKGDPATALNEPFSVVLTETVATKYFGSTDALGKLLTMDGKNVKVTGILKDVPPNSHLDFDFLVSMATAQQKGSGFDWLFTNWYSNNFYTYLLLPENFDASRLAAKLPDFDKRHSEAGNTTRHHYALEQLTDIYLHSDRANQAGKTGSLSNLYVFSIVACIILLVACINFVNLATARAAERAKEVAIKKVAGASKSQLMLQFFAESFLMTAVSLLFAILLCYLFLPAFNQFAGKSLSLDLFSPLHLLFTIALLVSIAVLAGSYPALALSAFKPAVALKGKIKTTAWSIGIRKGLVVFQFAVSIVLISCSLVIYRQLRFMQQHDLGFAPSQTLVVNFEGDQRVQQQYQAIRERLLTIPGIRKVTASSNVPGDRRAGDWSMEFAKKNGDTLRTELSVYLVDYNFLEQYRVPIVAGRGFSSRYAADTASSMIINEAALQKLGFVNAADALGVKVAMYPNAGEIVGVFKDFHYESLQKAIAPLAMRVLPSNFRLLSIEIGTTHLQQAITQISTAWDSLVPQRPLEYAFLDESFNRQYLAEMQFEKLFTIFTSLAIIIACLGLFGLALFSTRQRTKEIGIRKVLGASVGGITGLLSGDFIKLVFIALLIASPISWFAISKWLEGYTYRITISWWLFVVAGVIAMLVALLTISFHALKAAIANPVKSLRSE